MPHAVRRIGFYSVQAPRGKKIHMIRDRARFQHLLLQRGRRSAGDIALRRWSNLRKTALCARAISSFFRNTGTGYDLVRSGFRERRRAMLRTELSPVKSSGAAALNIEAIFGRQRQPAQRRARSIWISWIMSGRIEARPPVVPHPRIAARAFVLVRLARYRAPDWRHPVSGKLHWRSSGGDTGMAEKDAIRRIV